MGRSDQKEANVQKVHLQGRRPRSAVGDQVGEPDRVARLPCAPSLQPRHQAERGKLSQAAAKGKEGADWRGGRETGVRQDPPTQRRHHSRNVGSVIGIYNGKVFNQVEIKAEMIGYYIGEFSMTYKP